MHWWHLGLRPGGRIRAVFPTSNATTAFRPDKGPSVRDHRRCRLRYSHRHFYIFHFLRDAAIGRDHVEIVPAATRRDPPRLPAGRRCDDRTVAVAIRFNRRDISLNILGRRRERAFRRSLGNWRGRPPYSSASQAASVSISSFCAVPAALLHVRRPNGRSANIEAGES